MHARFDDASTLATTPSAAATVDNGIAVSMPRRRSAQATNCAFTFHDLAASQAMTKSMKVMKATKARTSKRSTTREEKTREDSKRIKTTLLEMELSLNQVSYRNGAAKRVGANAVHDAGVDDSRNYARAYGQGRHDEWRAGWQWASQPEHLRPPVPAKPSCRSWM